MSTEREGQFNDPIPDQEMDEWMAEHERIQSEMLAKYKPGQNVRVDDGEDQEPLRGKITRIYTDYNDGSLQSVFVDLETENGMVIERVLAEDILEIVS